MKWLKLNNTFINAEHIKTMHIKEAFSKDGKETAYCLIAGMGRGENLELGMFTKNEAAIDAMNAIASGSYRNYYDILKVVNDKHGGKDITVPAEK